RGRNSGSHASGRIRSASPPRRTSGALPDQASSFRHGTRGNDAPSACAICLGRFRHNVGQCNSPTLWNGTTKARCHRNDGNRIINPGGQTICLYWQRPRKCDRNHAELHECS
ncbi:hypothetical protein B0H16DRAFT_1266224, partial [Mycena metata]